MASKNPVLGYVPCLTPGCGGQMRVRQSARGRGGHVRKYGHCSTCGQLAQSRDDQERLSQYRQAGEETPEQAPEAAPVVESAPAAVEDWDPSKNPVETPAKPGKPRRRERSSGGAGRVIIGVLAVAAVALGAGALVKQ